MASSLTPERPLLISPSLAATIGLEEACMLSILSDFATYQPLINTDGHPWLELDESWVNRLMPFWTDYDIQRISKSLQSKGIIHLDSAPYTNSRKLILAFEEGVTTPEAMPPKTAPVHYSANQIPPNWQPDTETLGALAQLGVPGDFAWEQLPEFIIYWRERGDNKHSWSSAFINRAKVLWEEKKTRDAENKRRQIQEDTLFKRDQETAMHSQWRPSRDALEVLVKHAGINFAFVEDAIPEFVVYWQERGEVGRTWNSKFIQHVKRQWMRYNSALEHDTEPQRLPENWQPSKDVYDVLKLANIDLKFAQQQLPEFMLFWRDSNQIHASWNTKFLQHVKYHWAKQHALTSYQTQQVNQHAGQQLPHSSGRTKDRSLAEQLNDRSWAN